jgi:hypothetical protein
MRGPHVPSTLVVVGLFVAVAFPANAWGTFSSSTSNATSNLTAGTLQPPTGLGVTFDCVLIGILRPTADLTWIASSSAATGYQLDRYKGAVLESSVTISGTSTTAFADGLGLINLGLSTTYTWHLRTYLGSWTSGDAVLTASTPLICT